MWCFPAFIQAVVVYEVILTGASRLQSVSHTSLSQKSKAGMLLSLSLFVKSATNHGCKILSFQFQICSISSYSACAHALGSPPHWTWLKHFLENWFSTKWRFMSAFLWSPRASPSSSRGTSLHSRVFVILSAAAPPTAQHQGR